MRNRGLVQILVALLLSGGCKSETAPPSGGAGGGEIAGGDGAGAGGTGGDGGTGAVLGGPCATDDDCPAEHFCLDEETSHLPHGMCTKECVSDDECGGGHCNVLFVDMCFASCESAPCRQGYACVDAGDGRLSCLQSCEPGDCTPPNQCAPASPFVLDGMEGGCFTPEDCFNGVEDSGENPPLYVDCTDWQCVDTPACASELAMACADAIALNPVPPGSSSYQGDTGGGTWVSYAQEGNEIFCNPPENLSAWGFGQERMYRLFFPASGKAIIDATPLGGSDLILYGRLDCTVAENIGCYNFNSGPEEIKIFVDAGDTVYVIVDAASPGGEGPYELSIDYQVAVCGDSLLTYPEECDDGDGPGDGCADCVVEDSIVCSSAPALEPGVPVADTLSGAWAGFEPTVSPLCPAGTGDGTELVYSYTPTLTGRAVFSLSSTWAGLYVRDDCTDPSSQLGCIESAGCIGVDVVAGEPLSVVVDTNNYVPENNWDFDLSVTETTCGDGVNVLCAEECDDGNVVDGDGCDSDCNTEPDFYCANAPSIVAGQVYFADTTGGTDSFSSAGCGAFGSDFVFVYNPTATGVATIDVAPTAVTGVDPVIHVRTTCNDPASEVACADVSGSQAAEQLPIAVAAGVPLYIFLDTDSSLQGEMTLSVTQ